MRRVLTAVLLVAAFAAGASAQQATRGTMTTAGQVVQLDTRGASTASIAVSGTWSGTVNFEVVAGGGTDPVTVDCATPAAPGTAVNNTTSGGVWVCPVAGMLAVQARLSDAPTGTVVVDIVSSPAPGQTVAAAGGGGGGNDAASATGSAVPSNASYTGLNIGGNLVGQTGFTVGSSNGAAVAIIDGSGNQITSFGGGTQFAEDAAHSSGATGTMSLGVRTDSVAALAGATGDYQPFIFNSVGRLWTSATVDAALPAGTNNIGDVDVLSIAAGDNNIGNVDIVSGTITTVSTVTNVATIGTSVTPGTAAANLGKAEDAAHASGDTGVAVLGRRIDSVAASSGTSGDYETLNMDASGRVWVNPGVLGVEDAAETAGGNLSMVGSVRRDTAASSAGTTGDNATLNTDAVGKLWTADNQVEDAAHVSGDRGSLIFGVRQDTQADFGADGDYVPLSIDGDGLLRVTMAGGSGGTALADDADFTAGTTSFTPAGGFYQSTVTACTDGDVCAAGITAGRAVKVALANADGTLATYAADVVEDAAETAGGSGPMVLGVRRDTLASSAGTTGDNTTFNMSAVGALYTQPSAGTNGGCTPGSSISAGAVLETQIKATAGQLYSITVTATDATPVFLKIYNDTGANVDETDTPVQRFVVPSAATGGGITTTWNVGMAFSTAITFRITTGAADNDTGALTANEVLVSYCYL